VAADDTLKNTKKARAASFGKSISAAAQRNNARARSRTKVKFIYRITPTEQSAIIFTLHTMRRSEMRRYLSLS